jgi:hypothetical protein
MRIKIFLVITAFICGLYAPFELTRVILLIKAGYHPVAPWYAWYDIAVIWIGFVMMIVILLLVNKNHQLRVE